MSRKVIVTEISAKASEKTVKDFFLFCGKIKEFELIKEESSDKQIAYITFERETAAKTALMLTNAVIGDSQITVKSADDNSSGSDDYNGTTDLVQEDKPKGLIIAEILANGYTLQDTIVEKGLEIDERFGLTVTLKQYLTQVHANRTLDFVKTLDQKYQVTETVTTRATDINNKYSVYDHAKNILDQAQDKVKHFLDTPAGKIFYDYLVNTQQTVCDVQCMARRIADDKKERNYDPTPSHAHPEDQDSNQAIAAQ